MNDKPPAPPIDLAWVLSAIPDNVIFCDRDGRIQYINWTVPQFTPDQVVGKSILDFMAPEFAARAEDCLERVKSSGLPSQYEIQFVSDSGEVSEWVSRMAPVMKDGTVVGAVQVSTDLTPILSEEADRRALLNLSLDLMCVADFDGRFRRVNPMFHEILGYREDELVGASALQFVHPDDLERAQEALQGVAQGKYIVDLELRYLTKQGDFRSLIWRAVPQPARRLIYATARDVTDAKVLERQLQQSQRLDAVGQLAGGVAHDFNNVLQAIEGNARLLMRSEESADKAREITKAVDRAAKLTRQLLAFARARPARTEPLRLSDVVDEAMSLVESLIPSTISIKVDHQDEQLLVAVDRSQIEQVLMNLCINARDAMPGGGLLRIETCSAPGAAEQPGTQLLVQDQGSGMTPEVLEQIFAPFFTTKGPGAGVRLGLSTAYGIVRAHSGHLTAESEVGVGTRFRLWLPATDRPPHAKVAEQHRQPGRNVSPPSRTLLLADDTELVRSAITHELQDAGVQVIQAEDGEQALRLFEEHQAELDGALLDCVMPGKTGPGVAREIHERAPEFPIILMSGFSNPEMQGEGQRFLTIEKPFSVDELLERLDSLWNKPE